MCNLVRKTTYCDCPFRDNATKCPHFINVKGNNPNFDRHFPQELAQGGWRYREAGEPQTHVAWQGEKTWVRCALGGEMSCPNSMRNSRGGGPTIDGFMCGEEVQFVLCRLCSHGHPEHLTHEEQDRHGEFDEEEGPGPEWEHDGGGGGGGASSGSGTAGQSGDGSAAAGGDGSGGGDGGKKRAAAASETGGGRTSQASSKKAKVKTSVLRPKYSWMQQ